MRARFCLLPVLALALLAAACVDDDATAPAALTPIGDGVAFSVWTPGPHDTCSEAIHDQYVAVGPDRKRYPTWHPPVDPATGCSFGHEHGRDPSGSRLVREVGPIPFGYANEQLDAFDPANPRHEDHVGHKIEWENGVRMDFGGDGANALFSARCDVLTKLHQGTHSRDAFTNNVHELVWHIRCDDGTALSLTMLTAIGRPGEFARSCDRQIVQAGAAVPANAPVGGGVRIIPDRSCAAQEILVAPGERSNFGVLHENWETASRIRTADGQSLAFVDAYFQVFRPSRFHDASQPGNVGRPIALCYEADSATSRRARGSECEDAVQQAGGAVLLFDDPRSPFNGERRAVDINANEIRNAGGSVVWFTDPYGRRAQPDSFPGAIRQRIAAIDNRRGGLRTGGPTIGGQRRYGMGMAHAPN